MCQVVQKVTFVLIILSFIYGCSSQDFKAASNSFDLNSLMIMERFGNDDLGANLGEYLLVMYFNEVDCQTCINRDLSYLGTFSKESPAHLGFLIVAYPGDQKVIKYNLSKLRRVGRINCPIFLESYMGEARLGEKINISLIDVTRNEVVLTYYPTFSKDKWGQFERAVRQRVTK